MGDGMFTLTDRSDDTETFTELGDTVGSLPLPGLAMLRSVLLWRVAAAEARPWRPSLRLSDPFAATPSAGRQRCCGRCYVSATTSKKNRRPTCDIS